MLIKSRKRFEERQGEVQETKTEEKAKILQVSSREWIKLFSPVFLSHFGTAMDLVASLIQWRSHGSHDCFFCWNIYLSWVYVWNINHRLGSWHMLCSLALLKAFAQGIKTPGREGSPFDPHFHHSVAAAIPHGPAGVSTIYLYNHLPLKSLQFSLRSNSNFFFVTYSYSFNLLTVSQREHFYKNSGKSKVVEGMNGFMNMILL